MSMHLEGPWLSSISLKKRAEKITKAQREELERNWRDRNKRLKDMGLPKQTFEEFLDFVHGRKGETKTNGSNTATPKKAPVRTKSSQASNSYTPDLSYRVQQKKVVVREGSSEEGEKITVTEVPLEVTRPNIWVTGPTSSKQTPTYTGENIVGIGTMHKSNMVPIFSDKEAEEISKMRR